MKERKRKIYIKPPALDSDGLHDGSTTRQSLELLPFYPLMRVREFFFFLFGGTHTHTQDLMIIIIIAPPWSSTQRFRIRPIYNKTKHLPSLLSCLVSSSLFFYYHWRHWFIIVKQTNRLVRLLVGYWTHGSNDYVGNKNKQDSKMGPPSVATTVPTPRTAYINANANANLQPHTYTQRGYYTILLSLYTEKEKERGHPVATVFFFLCPNGFYR